MIDIIIYPICIACLNVFLLLFIRLYYIFTAAIIDFFFIHTRHDKFATMYDAKKVS